MDFDQLKDKLATGNVVPTQAPEQEAQEAQEAPSEIKYQHYKSARTAMCMTTYAGKKISFANYIFITADPDIIQYLDTEIDRGLNTVTKGELLTTDEADPMKILKAAHFQEFIDAQANAAGAGYSADMGNTKSKEAIAAGPAPMSSDGVAAN